MTTAEFTHIIDKLKNHTKYLYYHLMGEPLTHPNLFEFIKLANDKGFKSIITTNGTLLSERGEELLSAGVHKVNVSLHSFENDDEESLARYVSEIASFANRAIKYNTIVVFRLWNKGVDGGINDRSLKILKEYFPNDWAENARGVKIRDNIYLEWGERFEWPDINEKIKGERFFCYGLKDQFGILVDGTVVPCCLDSDGVIALGNVFENDLTDILNSNRVKAIVECFRQGKASEELCKRCGYAQRFIQK